MGQSNISWTEWVWNPVVGCSHAGMKGCDNCYARVLHQQRFKAWFYHKWESAPLQYRYPFTQIQCLNDRLTQPLHWKKPRKIFVDSMSDLFHPKVPFAFIDKVYSTMMTAEQHTYQILTKRPARALEYYESVDKDQGECCEPNPTRYMRNVHLLASASSQAEVDKVVPTLLQIPAAVRGLSLEPLLGPIDAMKYWVNRPRKGVRPEDAMRVSLDWVIVGCESGPNRRRCEIEWVRDIVRQCKEANVTCFVKQIMRDGKVFKLTEENKYAWPNWAVQEYPR